jgi:hypothetical protein
MRRVSRRAAALTTCRSDGGSVPGRPTTRNPLVRVLVPSDWISTVSSGPLRAALAGARIPRNRSSSPWSDPARRATRAGDASSAVPTGSSSSTHPSIERARRSTSGAVPPGANAARVRSCWTEAVRATAAYSSAARAAETAREIAMNGVLRGTSSSGSPASSAAWTISGTTASLPRPAPNPRAATPASTRRRTYGPAGCSSRSARPVVRSSSPLRERELDRSARSRGPMTTAGRLVRRW